MAQSELAVGADIAAAIKAAPLDAADMRRRLRAIFVGSMGNMVEWYDFYAYAAFALYFAHLFFPGNDVVVQQLSAALLFALGFLVRPTAMEGAKRSPCRCCSCALGR
jgi:MHS family alpha-ketoglutarate permease-like MFS transporter